MTRLLISFCLFLFLAFAPMAAHAQRVDQLPGHESASPRAMEPSGELPAPPPRVAAPAPVMEVKPPAPVDADALQNKIVAVVNDNVISSVDLGARLKLAILSSGLPGTPEVVQKLLPQILRGLIDEQLQMQEANKLGISISKDDVDRALDHIAHDNNIPGGDMRAFLRAHGIPPLTLEQQVRATLAWNQVLQREVRPRVDVGDDEVDAAIDRMRANAGKEEFLASEIFLAVDSPKDEEQIHALAEKLVQQIKSGARFGAVARQFSQGGGAASGGDIGWVQEGQLAAELNAALLSMKPGDIMGPVRSTSGYHILGLREKRTITLGGDAGDISLDLRQAFRPFDASASPDAVLREADALRKTPVACANLQARLEKEFPLWRQQNMGSVKQAKLPSWLADKIRSVPAGGASEPIRTDKGALVIFVCQRQVPDAGNINREAITSAIGTEKMELQARRLMRDLRRAAYMDVRI